MTLIVSVLFVFYKTLWRSAGGIYEIRWNPFWKLIVAFKAGQLCRDDFYNILLFAPFGFSLGLFRKKQSGAVLLGFLLSLFVELVQLTLHIGWFETEDIVMNTLGVFFGYMLYRIISRLTL